MSQSPPIHLHEDLSFTDVDLEDKFNKELVNYIKDNQKAFSLALSNEDMSPNDGDSGLLATEKKLTLVDAKEQIRTLKKANQALQQSHKESQSAVSKELLIQGQKRLALLLQSLEQNHLSQPKYNQLEQRVFDLETDLAKQKATSTEHVSFVEIEAFKHAIRSETITIVEFQIGQIQKTLFDRMTKIEARCKELGEECSEIIPRRLFDEFINRQHACQDELQRILMEVLPGIELKQSMMTGQNFEAVDMSLINRRRSEDMLAELKAQMELQSFEIKTIKESLLNEQNRLLQEREDRKNKNNSTQNLKAKRKKIGSHTRSESNSSNDSQSRDRKKQHSNPKVHVAFGTTVHYDINKHHADTPQLTHHKYPAYSPALSNLDINLVSSQHLVVPNRVPIHLPQIQIDQLATVSSQKSIHRLFEDQQVAKSEHSVSKNSKFAKTRTESTQNIQQNLKVQSIPNLVPQKQENQTTEQSHNKSEIMRQTVSSQLKQRDSHRQKQLEINQLSGSSSDSDESSNIGLSELQMTQKQVIKIKKEQRQLFLHLKQIRGDIQNARDAHQKLEGRVKHTEQVEIDLTTGIKKFNHEVQILGENFSPLLSDIDKISIRVQNLEREMQLNQQLESQWPKDQTKRQKYFERRIILAEQEIAKLFQELNLHKLEKRTQLDELQRRTSDVHELKREFATKSDFLYDQMQQTSKMSLAQIEEFGRQILDLKKTIKDKVLNLSKQTELFQAELERTQTINRNLMLDKTTRGLESSHFSRHTDVGSSANNQRNNKLIKSNFSKQQDSLGFDSVMSSAGENEDLKLRTLQASDRFAPFAISVERKSQFKPYTARAVPPLTVGDIQNLHNSTAGDRDRFIMLEDSINSTNTIKPKTTIQSTRDKVRNIIQQSQQMRNRNPQRENSLHTNDAHLKLVKQPVQKIELEKFTQSFN